MMKRWLQGIPIDLIRDYIDVDGAATWRFKINCSKTYFEHKRRPFTIFYTIGNLKTDKGHLIIVRETK